MDDQDFMLTTTDNPYDPFTQFNQWFLFDVEKGYNTCSYLARIAELSDDLSEVETKRIINQAIDKIIEHDFLNIYKRVRRGTAPQPIGA